MRLRYAWSRIQERSRRLGVVVVCLGLLAPWLVGHARSGQPAPTLDTAQRWIEESQALRKAGKYDDALGLAQKALALRERQLGADDPALADALHLVALILDDTSEYAKAEPLNRRALAIREKALGPDHPDVAQSLFNLAWIVKSRQDFAGAESLYRRALDIQERTLGPDDLGVATTLNDLAVLYNQTGRYDEAIGSHQRALTIRERAGNSDGVGLSLNNLARVHMNTGDYESAAEIFRRALAHWEAAVGADHPRVANALDGLAQAATASGDYATAEPLQMRVLAIRERALGADHPEVATTLNNLAVIYREKGDLERAVPLLLRDLAITETALGPDHSFVAPTLSNLGLIHQQRQEYAQAEARFRRALAIQERALGPDHLAVGITLNRLGRLYTEDPARNATDAEGFLQRALATLEKAVGPNHPEVAVSLSGLATLRDRQADDVESERLWQRALAIQERVLGTSHPDVAQSLERLAAVRQRQSDSTSAVAYLTRAYEIREHQLARNLPLGSDRQRVSYLTLFASDIDRAISLHTGDAPASPGALDLALTTLLRRKGRALDAAGDSVANLRRHAPADQRALFDRLAMARGRLAAVTLRGPSRASPAAYQANLRRLDDTVDRLEAALSAASAAFRAESTPITREAVQGALPADAVLVEYASYEPRDPSGRSLGARYVAYVLAPGGLPQWADLGEAATIDAAIRAWREALRNPQRRDASLLARAVDRLVMQPVRDLLGSSTHVLIAPDGQLNLVPFAALVDEQNRYLVERWTITYLTSGRDVLRLREPRTNRQGSVVVAAPEFGAPALVGPAGSRESGAARVDTSKVFFGPLPGVNDEVRALQHLLPDATFLTGPAATEGALRGLTGPRVLHIATHGFFLDADTSRTAAAAPLAGTRLGRWAATVENPLLRSGLALVGANDNGSREDDGLLTALEASSLDLWGTRMVVLSACDTGVGEIRNGQGVYGLRRALVLAGAESQLMSLWPVSDRSTRELMVSYYRQMAADAGRSEALRRAQLELVKTPRYAHPYYWASFIQSGAWSPLAGVGATMVSRNPEGLTLLR